MRGALRRRGLAWNGERDPTPPWVPFGASREQHYALLRRYSYRLFLRDVLKHRARFRLSDLTRYASERVAASYLRFLVRARLVTPLAPRGHYRVRSRRVSSFGGTLEWFVAEVLAREFDCAVAGRLRIEHAPGGGDYDVVACADGELVYVETKSAPPRQIVAGQVRAFLDRVEALRPDLALFLADTKLRMKDKLVVLFADEAARRRLSWKARRLEREIWRVGPEIYLLNADRDLVHNLGVCLAAHFRARGIRVAEAKTRGT